MKTLREIINVLGSHKDVLTKRYKTKEIGIFGSFVKGQQRETSDVDIIVEIEREEDIDAFNYTGLMNDLEKYLQSILGIKPHLASKRHAMSSKNWKDMEKEVVYIF